MLKANFRNILKRATRSYAPPTLLITIFLGANDAAHLPVGDEENIGLAKYDDNIREFVESVLIEDNLRDTKIVVITPPPINIPDPVEDTNIGPAAAAAKAEITGNDPKKGLGYRVYINKKTYAEKAMEIAKSYEETGRVIGLNLWGALIDAALEDQNRLGDEDAYAEERLPGCGLKWAKAFKRGYFTDGLHFGPLVSSHIQKHHLLQDMTNGLAGLRYSLQATIGSDIAEMARAIAG